jgi:hypothetical protein
MEMKKLLTFMLTFALSSLAIGQDTLDVPATDASGNPIINALTIYVVADTNAAGQQLHDVYRLERGKYYFYNQGPVFKNPITLVADAPGTTDETKPPKIIITSNDAGEVPYENCITTFANLTVKNIAFTTTSIDETYSWADCILLQADNLRIVMEGCIFELLGWGMIEAYTQNNTFIFDKCLVRNGTVLGTGDEWCPFFFEISPGSVDSLVARNNTFFTIQGTVINANPQIRIKHIIYDHNTMVNIVKGFSSFLAHTDSKITNNIFYNVGTHGNKHVDVATSTDGIADGVISVDTLDSNLPGATDPSIMNESARVLQVKNNSYFYSSGVTAYWTEFADSIEANHWIDSRAQAMFDDNTNYPNFIEENNVIVDPGFVNFGGTDDMVAQMRNHRLTGVFGFWGWDPDSATYPQYHWANLQWPLPENFAYSASITSTDGFHVGSLQWYPSELIQYNAGLTGVEENQNAKPLEFSLGQNYPNPFNPSTVVNFTLAKTGIVNLDIYNVLGQKVKSLIDNQSLSSGPHQLSVNMSDHSSGIYFLVLKQQNNNQVKKMVLMK